jgi:preprotein translocase subunit YajC
MESLIFPLLILVLFVPLFLSMRKQRRQFNEVQALQRSLVVGDRIMTTSGMHGEVVALTDSTVDLEIAPGVVTTWARQVVRERLVAGNPEPQPPIERAADELTADESDSR